jgi:hypothetical protein
MLQALVPLLLLVSLLVLTQLPGLPLERVAFVFVLVLVLEQQQQQPSPLRLVCLEAPSAWLRFELLGPGAGRPTRRFARVTAPLAVMTRKWK